MNKSTLLYSDNISDDIKAESLKLGENICNLAIKCQSQVYILSDLKSSNISCNILDSFIIDRTCPIFPVYIWRDKFNHLTLTNINDTVLYIIGCISGIDIINCKNIKIIVYTNTYINIENSLNINIFGPVLLEVSTCLDIILNNQYLNVNCFTRSTRYQSNIDLFLIK